MRSDGMKNFKKFVSKNKVLLLVGALIILFAVLSVLIKEEDIQVNNDVTEWYSTTKEGGVVVTVFGQTWCKHCKNFKPVMTKIQKEYGFKLFWFDLDEVSNKDRVTLENTYQIYTDFGTPYTFITNNGEFVADYQNGGMTEEQLIEFLKENKVIKTKED